MPDKDLFQRTFAPGWRKVYNLANNAAGGDSEVCAACGAAVAKSLRESKGCPGFNELAQIVTDAEREKRSQPLFVAAGIINLSKTFASIRQIEEKYKQNRMTKIEARAARSMLAREQLTQNGTEIRQNLAETVCLDLADHHFFGRCRNYLVGQRFGNFAEERKWETGIKEKLKISFSKLAANLAKNPNSTKIRAPGRKGIRKPTRELLDEPL